MGDAIFAQFLLDSGASKNVSDGVVFNQPIGDATGLISTTENGDEGLLHDASHLNSTSFLTHPIPNFVSHSGASPSSIEADHWAWLQTGPTEFAGEVLTVSERDFHESPEKQLTKAADDPNSAWYSLSDRFQADILGRLNSLSASKTTISPPTLRPQRPISSELGPAFDGRSPSFFNTAGDFHTLSAESTRTSLPSPNNCAASGNFLPSPDLDLINLDFLVAGSARGYFCINLGKAGDGQAEKLVVCNTTATSQKFKVLPPLLNVHPLVMHLRVDESQLSDHYKVIVAGAATISTQESPFLTVTQEYSSTTGEWECTANFSRFGLFEYQNGVYFTDSKRELLLCVGVLDMKLGTKGIVMYDLKEKQWEQGPIIPLAGPSESPMDNNYSTMMQIVECGGSIFVLREQEFEQDVYSCVYRLNYMKGTATAKLEEIMRRERTGSRGNLLVYLDHNCVSMRDNLNPSLLSATVLVESGYMFSELEVGKDVFICIDKFKPSPNGSGVDGVWEELHRRKRKRRRAPNWTAAEINAFLLLKEEGLGVVVGTDWEYISRGLEEGYGFIRGSKACEDLWGTLLKRHTSITNNLRSKNVHRDTSAWMEFWNHERGNHRITKNKPGFTLEDYERMDRILGIKPRRKAGGNNLKQIVDAPSSSSPSSCLSHPQVKNNPFPSTPVGSETLVAESLNNPQGDGLQSKADLTSEVTNLYKFLSGGDQNLTNKQRAKAKEEALELVKLRYQLDILKEEKKARSSTN